MKKTEYITFRTDQSTKASLETIAAEKKWTISQLTEEIIKTHICHYFNKDGPGDGVLKTDKYVRK